MKYDFCNRDNKECDYPNSCEFTKKCAYTKLGAELTSQPRIPEFIELLDASKAIHLKKNKDYASDNNPFSNFDRSAELISWFTNKQDRGFIGLIGTKLARLAELGDGRVPNNESVDDSFLDLLTYVGLWAAYRKRFPYKSNELVVICNICKHQALYHNHLGSGKCAFCDCIADPKNLY